MDKKINLIAEMIFGILCADSKLSGPEMRTLQKIAPQYFDRIEADIIVRLVRGYNGNPEFLDAAQELNHHLENEDKKRLYNLFLNLAESDDLDHSEDYLLKQLTHIWSIEL